eukprot:TRINITY_DN81715_c0_g1_i1.p2 TRINITY_DN81715_c0_g1~~TRINITY_DN81715_c0_g1_i1.p2  ORF type:complete len:256 (+),score=26.63 TRINITY_DN81715_c0_g1_i1:78-845(+)
MHAERDSAGAHAKGAAAAGGPATGHRGLAPVGRRHHPARRRCGSVAFPGFPPPEVVGLEEPYSGGVFRLEVQLPDMYPMHPPTVRFLTPIYHPNIDAAGRICLNLLKMPPKGDWRPALNIVTLLTSIQQLMGEPNCADPLMHDITEQYLNNRGEFMRVARDWTDRHARPASETGTAPRKREREERPQEASGAESAAVLPPSGATEALTPPAAPVSEPPRTPAAALQSPSAVEAAGTGTGGKSVTANLFKRRRKEG